MFHSARLKLTAWYLLIIMLVSMFFSVVTYRALTLEVDRFSKIQRLRLERRLQDNGFFFPPSGSPPPNVLFLDSDLVDEAKHRIILALVILNGGILLLAGALGYVLAGKTLTPIAHMMDEQNRFISDASHELKTPLTSLKSAFEVYLRDRKPSLTEARTLMSESILEVNKLQALSESLLRLAQYQNVTGTAAPFASVSIAAVIKEAVRKIQSQATQKNIRISAEGISGNVKGNADALTDLFVILLDNAVKYSPKASRVAVQSKRTDGSVYIMIADHGIGIAKKDLPRIFDRFYRADSARSKTAAGGYGLGLSIAKKIVDTHKGTVQVVSTPGNGSTFTVRLPAAFS